MTEISNARNEAIKIHDEAFYNAEKMANGEYQAKMQASQAKMNYADHLEGFLFIIDFLYFHRFLFFINRNKNDVC